MTIPHYPDTHRYAATHEWAALDGEICTIGITPFFVDQLVDVNYLELRPVGEILEFGKPFGEIESNKSVFDLTSPVAGIIVESNIALLANPKLILNDPYHVGWIIRVRLRPGTGVGHLLTSAQYQGQIASRPRAEKLEL